jgi:hypothetical protein
MSADETRVLIRAAMVCLLIEGAVFVLFWLLHRVGVTLSRPKVTEDPSFVAYDITFLLIGILHFVLAGVVFATKNWLLRLLG